MESFWVMPAMRGWWTKPNDSLKNILFHGITISTPDNQILAHPVTLHPFFYSVEKSNFKFDPQTVFGVYHPPACLRSNTSFIKKPAHNMSNKTLATLFYRCIDAWNFLPADLRLSQSLLSFKRGLKNFELSRFLKGSVYI
jgi:hypothetical protein